MIFFDQTREHYWYKVSNVLGFLVEGLGRRMLCFVVVSSYASFNVLWHGNGNGKDKS